jgi:hypothetical protein
MTGLTLADIERWRPEDIHAVFQACISRAEGTRAAADRIGDVLAAVPWEGQAHDAAMVGQRQIYQDLTQHAEEVEAVGRAASAAEGEVRAVKADWEAIKADAAGLGVTIDPVSETFSYLEPTDPAARAKLDAEIADLERRIGDVHTRATNADADLAAAINAAAGKESARAVDDELAQHGIQTPGHAEQDVHNALAGDRGAADRVARVLETVTPAQLDGIEPLTPEQGSVLSQLQAQQNGMSLAALKSAQDKLGADSRLLGDSWQLMSNSKIAFPQTPLRVGATEVSDTRVRGGLTQLPRSLQQPLTRPGAMLRINGDSPFPVNDYPNKDALEVIGGIVKDGSPALQHGSDIDNALMGRGTEMLLGEEGERRLDGTNAGPTQADEAIKTIFSGAGRDHIVDTGLITGSSTNEYLPVMTTSTFLDAVTQHPWDDRGQAAAGLYDWTHATTGPEAPMASQAADAYSRYLGEHAKTLLDLTGHQTLGQLNPALVQGFAVGLAPYAPAIAGENVPGLSNFYTPDSPAHVADNTLPIAKGVFSVLSTDPDASKTFNGDVIEDIAGHQQQYAQMVAADPTSAANTGHLDQAAKLQSLMDIGTHNAVEANHVNSDHRAVEAYALRKSAYDYAMKGLSAGAGVAAGPAGGLATDVLGGALEADIIGAATQVGDPPTLIPDMDRNTAYREALDGILRAHPVAGLSSDHFLTQGAGTDPARPWRLATWEELPPTVRASTGWSGPDQYSDYLASALAPVIGQDAVTRIDTDVTGSYNAVVKDPAPWDRK